MSPSHRTLFIVIGASLLLALLPLAAWLYFDVSYGRQLQRELDKVRAEHAPLSLTEAAPKAPPPDQNAATLYMPIFQVNLDPQNPKYPVGAKGLNRFDMPEARKVGEWAWAEAMRPVLASTDCRQALAALRQASLRPQCAFPVRWEDGSDAFGFPHLVQMRQATRLCSARAMVEARDGNMAGALDWLGVCYRMADQASQEPTLIAQLVGIAMLAITDKAARAVLDAGEVTPAIAARVRADLDRLQVGPRFAQAMRGERAMGLDVFRQMRTGDMSYAMISDPNGGDAAPRAALMVLAGPLRPYWKLEELNYLRDMRQYIDRVKQPSRVTTARQNPQLDANRGFARIMTSILLPVFGRAGGKRDQALAELDILRTGMALKLIKRDTGSYPATLDALRPSRARDIFTGRDFVYQRKAKGFKLYSIGVNLRDDHGVGYQRHTPPVAEGSETDDVAWECAR